MLRIGKSRLLVTQADDDIPQLTGRHARWVTFRDPGLYPVEIVYFQNASGGSLEWSRANQPLFGSDDTAVDDTAFTQQRMAFAPLGGNVLYSAVFGVAPSCAECGTSGQECAGGNYCGDGLCQTCNTSDHCGPSCMRCPADRNMCSGGKCIQCKSDDMCPAGSVCDIGSGICGPWFDICGPETSCAPLPIPCQQLTDCRADQTCMCPDYGPSCTQRICLAPPRRCAESADCPENYSCDAVAQICRLKSRYSYQGGLAGCDIAGQRRGAGLYSLLPLLAFLSCLQLAQRRREWIRTRARQAV